MLSCDPRRGVVCPFRLYVMMFFLRRSQLVHVLLGCCCRRTGTNLLLLILLPFHHTNGNCSCREGFIGCLDKHSNCLNSSHPHHVDFGGLVIARTKRPVYHPLGIMSKAATNPFAKQSEGWSRTVALTISPTRPKHARFFFMSRSSRCALSP